MPVTAMRHFREDLARAEALVTHGDPLPHNTPGALLIREDILRSGWMFAVGAMDAYFCDAYSDLIAATLLCKVRQNGVHLPKHLDELKVPVSTVLDARPHRDNWKWRIASRRLMARENILDLAEVQKHFNTFCRNGHKFFDGVLVNWVAACPAPKTIFGVDAAAFATAGGAALHTLRATAKASLIKRFNEVIIQRRHDCIHNCDRPKVRPQRLPIAGTVRGIIRDIRFLVEQFDQHISAEFRLFLQGLGFSNPTIVQVGY